ncbi:MAG: hypothetical protein HY606_06945, partial [Planctomycetes bacterium]|nr:hypothetical protein [Planctomycetota bacterium]
MKVDQEFLDRLLNRDNQAYHELISGLEKPLINFIYRYVNNLNIAEDIFQETFVRFLRALP